MKLPVIRKADSLIYCPRATVCAPTLEMWDRHNALIASRRESLIAYQSQQTIQPQPAKGFGLGLVALLGLLLHV